MEWAAFMLRRAYARLFDHRVWIVGIGVGAFVLSLVLFATLPQQFQPTTNSEYSQDKYELQPGSKLEQSETHARQISSNTTHSQVVDYSYYKLYYRGRQEFPT